MTVNDFLKKYHRQAVYCNSFYIQFYSYLKNEMDIEFKCKLFKDERGTDMNILYKYLSCKIKNFSIKSFFTCYPQGNKEEIFITLSIYIVFVFSCGNNVTKTTSRYEGAVSTSSNTKDLIANKCILISDIRQMLWA